MRAFSLLAAMMIFLGFASKSVADLKDGLVGLWLFDEGKGKDAKDSSGNGNNGTLDGAADWTGGKYTGALQTTPQNGVTVPVTKSLDTVVDALSIGAWFRIDKDSDTGLRRDTAYLLEDQSATEATPDAWAFGVWNEGGAITLAWGLKKITKGEWTHIAGTYDGKVLQMYVNGEPDTAANMSGKVGRPGNPLGLGRYSSETYIGGIDEAFLYNRALSQTEIKSLMKGWASALAVQPTGKLATVWAALRQ
jgi:hypothetical protein